MYPMHGCSKMPTFSLLWRILSCPLLLIKCPVSILYFIRTSQEACLVISWIIRSQKRSSMHIVLILQTWSRKGCCFVLCTNGCRDTQHPTWRTKEGEMCNGDQVAGRQRPACTPLEVLLWYFWGLCAMSCLICMFFVADLMAYKLSCFLCCACRPVTARLCCKFIVWLLKLVPVAPNTMVWRFLRCPSKRGNSSLLFVNFCLLGRRSIITLLDFDPI